MLTFMTTSYESWDDKYRKMKGDFNLDKIASSSRKQLEHYLIIIANTPMADKAESDRLATVISHLLQVRINEELHGKSYKVAIVAIVVAFIAAAAAVWQAIGKCLATP